MVKRLCISSKKSNSTNIPFHDIFLLSLLFCYIFTISVAVFVLLLSFTPEPPVDSHTILAGVKHQKEYSEAGWSLQPPGVLPDASDGDAEATREDA